MSSVSQNLKSIKEQLPEYVTLVAVSKTQPNEMIMEAYEEGQRIFGENKVQELVDKQENLPKDIQWHMIGHLQRNKVKYIAPFVALIHGVDSLRLLRAINKEGARNERIIPCLLQMHIASEETKFGLDENELFELLESEEFRSFSNVEIHGLMGMATFTNDEEKVASEFRYLKKTFDLIGEKYFETNSAFSVLSMGMSGDYETAVAEGSNMVRIGSSIFGERNYR
ncbi:YggS family pyridoxal phosphate-dependent enzyme [Marinilabilia sp.]|uniref:YggS family pyridoxal phosphate-dependent enzyme n=1 Tax=Marinilabilia sp. TaxID=2021252 RepID=UPI0025B7B971|nr:YggS family pyridoxal phosphate-dependent enzyme [Marinilabilia sp.]